MLNLQGLRETSVLHLHWMSGVADLSHLVKLGLNNRKIVWTLHDMGPFTGFCHQSEECLGFQAHCEQCPLALSAFQNAISSRLQKNLGLISKFTDITIVAPTPWMANRAESSSVFRGSRVRVVGNPIGTHFFDQTLDRNALKRKLGIDDSDFVVAQIAQNLKDPNKRITESSKTLSRYFTGAKVQYRHLLVGGNGSEIAKQSPFVTVIGKKSNSEIASVLGAADLLVSTSKSESAGLTILEAAALGVPSIMLGETGSRDLIVNGVTGVIVDDWEQLGQAVLRLSKNPVELSKLGVAAKAHVQANRPYLIAKKYLEIYEGVS
jgi:glycosyltransferase involved in cell wall biosynthesis